MRAGETWNEYPIAYPVIAGLPKAAAVGDIDLDGRPDIVLSAPSRRAARGGESSGSALGTRRSNRRGTRSTSAGRKA